MLRRRRRPEPVDREPQSPIPPFIPDIVDVERLTRDPLTGTLAPWLFGDRLEHARCRLERSGRLAALLLIDVDRLDVVNEALGLDAGDELLREFAARVAEVVDGADTLARMGGDEFGVLVDELTGPEHAGAVAEGVLAAVREPFDVGDDTVITSASIGIVRIDGTEPVTELRRRAELALARAKGRGGSCYAAYEERTTRGIHADRQLEWALRRRLEAGSVDFLYQPVLELRTGALAFVESRLPRQWHEVGTVDPGQLRRVAAVVGLAGPLLRVELATAAHRSAAWSGETPIAVPVPAPCLAEGWVDRAVAVALEQAGAPPSSLVVSVTADALDHGSVAVDQLEALHAAGTRIALHVAGGAAFDALRRVPADLLLLDGMLLDELRSDRSRAVAGAVLGIAEVLDAAVVACGVDGEGRLEAARSLGVDLVEGDRIGPPLEAAELDPWFSRSASPG